MKQSLAVIEACDVVKLHIWILLQAVSLEHIYQVHIRPNSIWVMELQERFSLALLFLRLLALCIFEPRFLVLFRLLLLLNWLWSFLNNWLGLAGERNGWLCTTSQL